MNPFIADETLVACPRCRWAGTVDTADVMGDDEGGQREGDLWCPKCGEPIRCPRTQAVMAWPAEEPSKKQKQKRKRTSPDGEETSDRNAP